MAETKSKGETKAKKAAPGEVNFKCSLCEKQRPISEMRVIKRFRPVLLVCRDCEKGMQ
jgi:hypothetical protein